MTKKLKIQLSLFVVAILFNISIEAVDELKLSDFSTVGKVACEEVKSFVV